MSQWLAVYLDCSRPNRMYPNGSFPKTLVAGPSPAELAQKAASNAEAHRV